MTINKIVDSVHVKANQPPSNDKAYIRANDPGDKTSNQTIIDKAEIKATEPQYGSYNKEGLTDKTIGQKLDYTT